MPRRYGAGPHFLTDRFALPPTLKVTPATAAGATDKRWEMPDMVKVLEDWENTKQQRSHE